MPINSKIIGPDGLPVPALIRDKHAGLLVATIPAQHKHFMLDQFISTDGYENLDVDIGGDPLIIWNGTGGLDTGGDWTRGGDSGQNESTDAAHSGTNGLDTDEMDNEDVTTFTAGSPIDLSSYLFLSFWINAQNWPNNSEINLRWYNGSTEVGKMLHEYNYTTVVVGSWVNVKIPMADFELDDTVDSIEFEWHNENNIHVYLDDVELLTSAGGGGTKSSTGIFRISGLFGEVKEIHEIRLVINTASSGWEATDFTLIDGGLDAGVLFRWWDYAQGVTQDVPTIINANLSRNIQDNLDLFGFFDIETNIDFLDSGRLLVLSLDLSATPIHLIGTQVVDLLVRDNLSAITSFRAYAIGNRRFDSLQHDELEDGC